MRLDAMVAEIRPRNRWEAMDLGWLLARNSYPALLRAWALLVWPVWAVILVGFRQTPVLGLALIWWLKPLAERVPLLVLSREMFGEQLSLGQVLRHGPRIWFRGLFHFLVVTRLSPSRHVLLPERELEELRGKVFGQRAARLAEQCGAAPWLMQATHLVFLHSLSISIVLLTIWMIPERFAPDWELLFAAGIPEEGLPPWCLWVWSAIYLTSLTLVTPFTVGAGFGLYLNARTKMEGWDIEISFRRLAARVAKQSAGAVLILLPLLLWAQPSGAAEEEAWDPGTAMQEILAGPEFKIHTRTEFRPAPPKEVAPPPGWLEWVGAFSWAGSEMASGLGWLLISLTIITVTVFLMKWIASAGVGRSKAPAPAAPVVTVMGMNVRQDSLPRDIVAEARKLLKSGQFDEAMALLYRGALSWLIHRAHVPILESDTEADCVARVRRVEGGAPEYFEQLTRVWSAAVYGSRRAGADEIERLLAAWPYAANRKEAAS